MSKRKEGSHEAPAMITASRIWPLFNWTECKKCRSEFRRQFGWGVRTSDNHLSGTVTLCVECCPTASSAIEFMRVTVAAADRKRRFAFTQDWLNRVS